MVEEQPGVPAPGAVSELQLVLVAAHITLGSAGSAAGVLVAAAQSLPGVTAVVEVNFGASPATQALREPPTTRGRDRHVARV